MATQLFLLDTVPDTHLGTNNANLAGASVGWEGRALGTARGSGSVTKVTNTVAGTTLGIEVTNGAGGNRLEWISPPVSADVTISGTVTLNIWAQESSNSANTAINIVIEVIRANALGTANSNTLVQIVKTARTTELSTSRIAVNFTSAVTSTVVNRGDRLRVRVFGDDAGTMGTGFTFTTAYNGTTGAADGDTYVQFTETFAFESAPAGSQLFLTNQHPGLTGAPALLSDFTGADENPLSEGGNWANLNTSSNPLKRLSNQAAATVNAAANASYWTPGNFGPDLEAYATIATLGAQHGIFARIQGEGGAATWDGYGVQASSAGAGILRFDNAVQTTLLGASAPAFAAGDKVGIRLEGSLIQAWRQPSGSSNWSPVAAIVDATYPSAGKVGLYQTSTTGRMDDFYAATDSNLFTNEAWTSRGDGVVSHRVDTNAGWLSPLFVHEWFTPQLQAFTLTGKAVANVRASEASAAANASARCEIAVVDSDGTNATVWSSWCIAPITTDLGELDVSEAVRTCNLSGDDLAVTSGQRLRFRIYLEDNSATAQADASTVSNFYNGTSAAASGDAYVTLAQTISELATAFSLVWDPVATTNYAR